MDLTQDYFAVFGLVPSFQVEPDSLDHRYHELQRLVHPDTHSGGSASDQRQAVQWAAHVNTAYQTLKQPLSRAIYLMTLSGQTVEHNPTLAPAFLMEQIELREALETLGESEESLAELDAFKADVRQRENALFEAFAESFDNGNKEAALATVYKIQFLDKLAREADALEEKLLDY